MKWLSPLGSRKKKNSVPSVEPSPVTSPEPDCPPSGDFARRRMSLPSADTPPSRLRSGLFLPQNTVHPHSLPPSPHIQQPAVPAIQRTACTPCPSSEDLPSAQAMSSPSWTPPKRTLSPLISHGALPTMPLSTIYSNPAGVLDDGIDFDLLGPPEGADSRTETPEPAKYIPQKPVETRRLSAAYDACARPKSVPGQRLGGFSADTLSEGLAQFSLMGIGRGANGSGPKLKRNPLKRTNTQPIVMQTQAEGDGDAVLRKQNSVPSLTQLVDEEGEGEGEGEGGHKGDIPEGTSMWRGLVGRSTIKKDRSAGQLGGKKERKRSIFSWIGSSTRQPANLQRELSVRVVAGTGGEPKEYKVCVGPTTTVQGVRSMVYQLHSKTSPEAAACWGLYFIDQAGNARGPLSLTEPVIGCGAPMTFELREVPEAVAATRRDSVWSEGDGVPTRKAVDVSSEYDKPTVRRQSLPAKAGGQLRRSFREKINRLTSGSASNLYTHPVVFDCPNQDQHTSSGSIVDGADSSSVGEDDVWWEKRDGAAAVLAVASVDALVPNLGMLCYTDVEFFDMFVLTYRHILSPLDLLTRLTATFDDVRGGVLTPEQLRNLNIVFKWIDQATFDFMGQPDMVDSITRLQATLSKLSYPMLQDRLAKALALVSGSDIPERGHTDPTATQTPPSNHTLSTRASVALSPSQDFFGIRRPDDEAELSFPEMLSRGRELQCALVHCEWGHFRAVHPWALLAALWPKQGVWPNSARQSMERYAAWFNKVSYWVCTEVVLCSDVRQRAVILEGFVRLGKALQRMGAYNTAYAVCTGLNHGAVQRLKRSWELVPSEGLKRMAELEELFSPMQNFSNYRQNLALDQRGGVGVVPVTSVVLKDLTGLNEIPRTLDNGYINVHKLRLVAGIVKEFRTQQECGGPPPECDAETSALRYVRSLPVLPEKAAYHLSYIHEPRDGALTLRAKLQLIKDWPQHNMPPHSPSGRGMN